MSRLTQPIKWHGGKHYLASRIVAMMPPHSRYLEAYAGGLSVLLAKPHDGVSEFANDTHGDLTNFWRVLRDTPDAMLRKLWATPLSESEFAEAKAYSGTDSVKRATAFFIAARQSRQGLQESYCTPTRRTRRAMNENVSAWLTAIDGLPEVHERLKRVEVWGRPAVEAIRRLDQEDFCVYCDPPYLNTTRSTTGEYGEHEMTVEQHEELLATLSYIKGKFLLSGYRSDLYDAVAEKQGWHRTWFSLPNNAAAGTVRTKKGVEKRSKERKIECIWTNYEPQSA